MTYTNHDLLVTAPTAGDELRAPNAVTLLAMQELEDGARDRHDTVESLLEDLHTTEVSQ